MTSLVFPVAHDSLLFSTQLHALLATRQGATPFASGEFMIRTTVVIATFATFFVVISGCHLYIEEGGEPIDEVSTDCQTTGRGCESPADPWPDAGIVVLPPDGGGFGCLYDSECGFGCFCNSDGDCEEFGPLPDAAPPTCSDVADEGTCTSNSSCLAVYRGINCTASDGAACTSESANCTCESYVFDSCDDA